MKYRNSFITNSSSSSFIIDNPDKRYYPNLPDYTIESINEKLNKILDLYEDLTGRKVHREYIHVVDTKDINVVKELYENECWSASGKRLPDLVHEFLDFAEGKEIKDIFTYNYVQKLLTENNFTEGSLMEYINISIISLGLKPEDIYSTEYRTLDYYDCEFQNAIRADFLIIGGDNVIPYECIDFIKNMLDVKTYTHLG